MTCDLRQSGPKFVQRQASHRDVWWTSTSDGEWESLWTHDTLQGRTSSASSPRALRRHGANAALMFHSLVAQSRFITSAAGPSFYLASEVSRSCSWILMEFINLYLHGTNTTWGRKVICIIGGGGGGGGGSLVILSLMRVCHNHNLSSEQIRTCTSRCSQKSLGDNH